MSRVAVVGEALIDVVHTPDAGTRSAPGGSPANVALTLGRRGVDVRLFTRLGDDDAGLRVREWLEASGVHVVAAPADRTASAVARLDDDGAATYDFDLDWAAVDVPSTGVDVLHVGSVSALLTPDVEQLLSAVKAAATPMLVTYDPNLRPALLGAADGHRSRVERIVARADIVKASDEDLGWLYPRRDPLDAARTWARTGPALVVLTRGAEGAHAVTARGDVHVAAPPVAVVDTVGAGDTFMGTLIAELVARGRVQHARAALRSLSESEVRSILEASARAAAVTVSRPGADPPWGELAGGG